MQLSEILAGDYQHCYLQRKQLLCLPEMLQMMPEMLHFGSFKKNIVKAMCQTVFENIRQNRRDC